MRILHISAMGLPDGRVERMALIDKLLGHETFYAGPHVNGYCIAPNFDGVYSLPQNWGAWFGIPIYYGRYKRRLEHIIKAINPDIIHCHNIYSVMGVMDSGYPFILNDHELLSMQLRTDYRKDDVFNNKLLRYGQLLKWPKREKDISKVAPVITVSNAIAKHYDNLGAKSFVVPNYPTKFELSNTIFSKKVKPLTTTYLGSTFNDTVTYRNSAGLIKFFDRISKPLMCVGRSQYKSSEWVEFTGYIPHMELFTELSKYHVGIVPWRKHPYHKVCSLNKVFTYAHCGLVVVVTSYLHEVIKSFKGRCHVVDKYEDLEWVLQDLDDDIDATITEGEMNKKFAMDNFLLDNYKDVVEEAYRHA